MSAWYARSGARTALLALFLTALVASDVLAPVYAVAAGAVAAWLWFKTLVQLAGTSGDGAERARDVVTAIVVAVAAGSVWYRITQTTGLAQTAALFVGVPAVLAIVVTHFVSPTSAAGVAVKTVTIGLLVSLMLLDEGLLCVLMSAPLFFMVALGVASAMSSDHDAPGSTGRRLVPGLIGLTLVPMSLEGVTSLTTIDRNEVVSVTRIVDASAAAVARALLAPPRFDRERPALLRMGFPWPEAARVETHSGGPVWDIAMRGGETKLTGMEPKTGTLRLALEHLAAGEARWRVLSDDSHMRHFLTWVGSDVRYAPIDGARTTVTWTIRYRRDLDPAWYFGPLERGAVRLAAGYLIDTVATP